MIEDESSGEQGAPDENADTAALSIALVHAATLDPRAAAYLEEQTRLARLQIARMRAQDDRIDEEQRLRLSHLRVRRLSDYSKVLLEISIGLFLLAVVFGFAIMVWNALHDHSLVIEAFAVPPDMAARGVTGQTVAAELLDKLAAMEASTQPTAQTETSYRVDKGDAIRIAIPETGGLSLGEIDRYLRETFGHETHVTGELVHTTAGLALTLRAGGASSGVRLEGTEANLDLLMQKTAEALFVQTEPLRYGDYLADSHRYREAIALLRPLALQGAPADRARALTSWAEALDFDGKDREALPVIEEGLRLAPDASFAWAVDSDIHIELGHDDAAHRAEVRMLQTVPLTWSRAELASPQLAYLPSYIAQRRDGHEGDFVASALDWNRMKAVGGNGIVRINAAQYVFEFAPQLAIGHDLAAARHEVAEAGDLAFDQTHEVPFANAVIAFMQGNWQAVVSDSAVLDDRKDEDPYVAAWARVQLRPLRAIAMAQLGDFAGAEALIANTPTDCDRCARARGTIAALRRDWIGAEHWYTVVAARSPSIPFADADWGETLLHKGDFDGAIAKFEQAHAKGPHFADPLEMWGEALIAKNRSDLALAKFEEADKYAPNWGRLHLKWGEALMYLGRPNDAKKQFETASHLDLSPAEASALVRLRART